MVDARYGLMKLDNVNVENLPTTSGMELRRGSV